MAHISQADLNVPKNGGQQVRDVHAQFGRLDILVLNAGVYYLGKITQEQYDRMFNINVHAPYEAVEAARDLIADNGRIITLSSVAPQLYGSGGSKV